MSAPRPHELSPAELRRSCDATKLGFATTAELPDLDGLLGQDRACSALEFGTRLRAHDYNVFALGPPGLGKHAFVRKVLEEHAATRPAPTDWCYVHDFADRSTPRAIGLPAGRGAALRKDVASLLEEIRDAIPRALESEEFRARRKAVEDAEKTRREAAFKEVQTAAETANVAILGTPGGMALAPIRLGEVVGPEQFTKLSKEEQDRYNRSIEATRALIEKMLEQVPRWHRESHAAIRKLAREATAGAVHHLVDELRARWLDLPDVGAYLDALEADVVENGESFVADGEESSGPARSTEHELPIFRRYRVNVIVDHSATRGAPVVYEDHPTHANLFGRVEHVSVLGALLTDFNLIKAGAVHRANGGYLILDALKLLQQPFSWDELKRALRARTVRMESPLGELGIGSTVSLAPGPIPLDLKVVLVGERRVYYLLSAMDPEFAELFKVAADFEEDAPWTDESLGRWARLVATVARRERVRPLDAGAVALLCEESARDVEDRERLSLDLQRLADVLREADHEASRASAATITAEVVSRALAGRIRRADRVRDVLHEQIRRGTILVDTRGKKIGQVNALSVLGLADFAFARPTRITARARLGRGEVVDIEREVELGGPIHSKGVLIMQGFLAQRYAAEMPLSLSATLVFEQSYGGVEGDSASLAELCGLLSAIGEVPLAQSLAVTGSINQQGDVQPVGAINEKIEGFYDACRIQGLTGEQGVVIPRRSLGQLMLRTDVVAAVREGRFHVFAVDTVDEALELLAGMKAGERELEGPFPDETVNGAVEQRLILFAAASRAFESAEVIKSDDQTPRHLILKEGIQVENKPEQRN